jgi:hypothetical protein
LETSDPKARAANIEHMLRELIDYVGSDVDKVDEPNALVLFETSARC